VEWLDYRDGQLCADGVRLADIADEFGTPCYVYSRRSIERRWQAYDEALQGLTHQIFYAVKANSNLAVLQVLARLGSGFDIVSVGELERVLRAGGDPRNVVFAGVGKRDDELQRALEAGIGCFNVESFAELEQLNSVAAKLGLSAPVALRVNPDVDPNTHPYIATGLKQNKFGIAADDARDAVIRVQQLPFLELRGIGCHIGSQLTDLAPIRAAVSSMLQLVDELAKDGIELEHVDVGGGLGVRYRDETPPGVADYAAVLKELFTGRALCLLVEPGRSIVADAGILLTRVELVKKVPERRVVVVDAAMNDLLRPSLYNAWQPILTVRESAQATTACDVVGPICESGDFLGKNRHLKAERGDLLAIAMAGAYGFVMSSNYNSRPRACEVMIDAERPVLVRARETVADLMAGEAMLS
jgi:diaminopimelate decarboxylase